MLVTMGPALVWVEIALLVAVLAAIVARVFG